MRILTAHPINPSTVFSTLYIDQLSQLAKIHRRHWKERLKMSKAANLESVTMNTNKDMALQSRKLFKDVSWWGASLCPHHTNVYKIPPLCGAISSLVFDISLSNSASLLISRHSFWQCQLCFANWSLSKVEKNHGRVCSRRNVMAILIPTDPRDSTSCIERALKMKCR